MACLPSSLNLLNVSGFRTGSNGKAENEISSDVISYSVIGYKLSSYIVCSGFRVKGDPLKSPIGICSGFRACPNLKTPLVISSSLINSD